jgi:acyl-coenzyme A synthetase/AMP-(fatty) acid ligase
VIYDENRKVVEPGSGRAGNICIRNPWPGIFQTIWGQPERFVDTYFKKYCLQEVLPGPGEQGLARLAGHTSRVTAPSRHRMATFGSLAVSTM